MADIATAETFESECAGIFEEASDSTDSKCSASEAILTVVDGEESPEEENPEEQSLEEAITNEDEDMSDIPMLVRADTSSSYLGYITTSSAHTRSRSSSESRSEAANSLTAATKSTWASVAMKGHEDQKARDIAAAIDSAVKAELATRAFRPQLMAQPPKTSTTPSSQTSELQVEPSKVSSSSSPEIEEHRMHIARVDSVLQTPAGDDFVFHTEPMMSGAAKPASLATALYTVEGDNNAEKETEDTGTSNFATQSNTTQKVPSATTITQATSTPALSSLQRQEISPSYDDDSHHDDDSEEDTIPSTPIKLSKSQKERQRKKRSKARKQAAATAGVGRVSAVEEKPYTLLQRLWTWFWG
ncbi:hypothetical protein Slin14017_G102900 [Septoria linicola]|nr:hypothetical protein Slin14017_G102900 [Septoria linicola]